MTRGQRIRAILFLLPVLAGMGSSGCSPAREPADILYIGPHILTMSQDGPDGVSAVAIRGERIAWTGPAADAGAWQGPGTRVVELGERALLPGFIDAHGHLTYLAATVRWANVAPPPVGPVSSVAELQAVLRQYISERGIGAGAWVLGLGYDDSLLAEGRHPTRDDLDAVSTEHPIALQHVSGHLAAANSAALAAAGIAAETPDPAGGVIRRRPGSSEPNGVLEETATYALRAVMMAESGVHMREDIQRALGVYAENGVTTAQDGAFDPAALPLLRQMDAAGELFLDVNVYPLVRNPEDPVADLTWGRQPGERLNVAGVKLLLDGSPQGKTAYLSQPYHVPPEGQPAGYRGYPIYPAADVDAMVRRHLAAGVPVIAHANGDAAADMLIDAVAKAHPQPDHRTVMIHAQTVREDQLDRMAALGIIPSFFSAHTFFWGDWHRDSVLGPERAARISPTRSALNRGIRLTVHNDTPIVPPDMVRLLWATTNRITRSGRVLGADQALTVAEALRAITVDAAYQSFEEADKGTITPGRLADLVVVSTDPVGLGAKRLLELEVVATMSRGRIVFGEL